MKKMSATILSVALAGSLAVVPASAIAMGGGMGAARAAVRAGMEQTLASPNDRAAIEVVDQAGSQAAGHAGNQPANQMPVQDAGRLEINEPGTYVLTGNLRGTVDVNPGAGDVRLVLDNATIDGNGGPAIRAKSGDSLTISLPEGSFNRVMSSGMGQDCRGTIFGDVNMRFEGPGALTVVGNNQPGIFANDAQMTFGGGDFTFIGGGFGMQAGGNAPGNVVVNGGAFSSQPGMEMVAPGTNVMQNGGSFGQRETVPFSGYNDYMQQNPWTSNPQDVPQQGGMQQPDAQQPGMQQPGAQQPGMQQPGVQQGGMQQPGAQQGGMQQPGAQPSSQQPGMQQPNGQQPNGQQPGAQQPGAQQPGIPQEGTQQASSQPSQQASGQNPGQGQIGQPTQIITGTSTTASEIVTSDVANTAAKLYEDLANAINYLMTNVNSQVKISDAGTYVISGSATDGNITVKKGTTGVVLVLEDLDLTSTTGATLSVNKNAEVKIVVSGNVTLTDNENPADEESTDEVVADAYDGAAIKVKAGSQVYLTGDGTLTLNGNAKNGIKVGDEANLVIDGTTLNVTAAKTASMQITTLRY